MASIRFEQIGYQDTPHGCYMVIRDNETGVHYLQYLRDGHNGDESVCICPLLNSSGQPYIQRPKETYVDDF